MANNAVKIRLSDPKPMHISFDDKIVLKYVSLDHDDLENLDYEHSGHTGFMPSKLNLLPELSKDVSNDRLKLSVFDSEGNDTSQISFKDLAGRIIKTTGKNLPTDLQEGQYLFVEIEKEDI